MPAIQAFIRVLTNSLDMEEHRNKLSKQLSGGNKRKLSLALSMMGAPDVMILDEPSAGIDPNARQNMVNIIKGERDLRDQLEAMGINSSVAAPVQDKTLS